MSISKYEKINQLDTKQVDINNMTYTNIDACDKFIDLMTKDIAIN